MQEKLLKKPPPRYVYDILIATMNVTGFPKGLYTDDEMNPKFFDESPHNKIEIFQKTIEITKIVLNEQFEIKTTNICKYEYNSIVKGDEPEKTNFFLQAFYRAATTGKDQSKFITKYFEHRKKKKEETAKTDETKTEVKKTEISSKDPKKEVKTTTKEVKVETKSTQETKTTTEKPKLVRPESGVKRPEKITSETKEIKEDNTTTTKVSLIV
jgi:TRAF3-interacting protein 1